MVANGWSGCGSQLEVIRNATIFITGQVSGFVRLDHARKIFELLLVAFSRLVHLKPTVFDRMEAPNLEF